jgi:hypothetical protein
MWIWVAVTLLALGSAGLYPIRRSAPSGGRVAAGSVLDLTAYSDSPPSEAIDLLFIHHSVGGQLLAETGPADPSARLSIHRTHPNGGGLRALLESQGYVVHEASYGSEIGARTDLFDWLPKFRMELPRILATDHQDRLLRGRSNRIVLFKSCYPNSAFRRDGLAGNPAGPALTLSNGKATMLALRQEFARCSNVLFVYLTAPPLRARVTSEPLWRYVVKRALGRPCAATTQLSAADDAREFNDWVKSPTGWLRDYPQRNVVVFDYFDLLTGGHSNFLQFANDDGRDDHPSTAGQHLAATQLVTLLNRAVRYSGIVADAHPAHHR